MTKPTVSEMFGVFCEGKLFAAWPTEHQAKVYACNFGKVAEVRRLLLSDARNQEAAELLREAKTYIPHEYCNDDLCNLECMKCKSAIIAERIARWLGDKQ